jgi:hypothetical protein
MPRSGVILDIFLSSPSDVEDERNIVEKTVNELNREFVNNEGRTVNLMRWETSALSGVGADAQDVVDRALFHRYDLYVGIIGHRFGTPTLQAGSGTEEEFNRAIQRYEQGDRSIDISFFVRDTALPPDVDTVQLERVRTFKKKLTESGVLSLKYEHLDDFRRMVERHIREYAKKKIDAYLASAGTGQIGENIGVRILEKLHAVVALLGRLNREIAQDIAPYLGKGSSGKKPPLGGVTYNLLRRLETAEKVLAAAYSETRMDIRKMAADWVLMSDSQPEIRSSIELVNSEITKMQPILRALVFDKNSYSQLPAPVLTVFDQHASVVNRTLHFLQDCESNFQAILTPKAGLPSE